MLAILNNHGKLLNNILGEAFSLLNVYRVDVCTCASHQLYF